MASWLVISALLGSDHPAMDDRQRDGADCRWGWRWASRRYHWLLRDSVLSTRVRSGALHQARLPSGPRRCLIIAALVPMRYEGGISWRAGFLGVMLRFFRSVSRMSRCWAQAR